MCILDSLVVNRDLLFWLFCSLHSDACSRELFLVDTKKYGTTFVACSSYTHAISEESVPNVVQYVVVEI